jgi:hypothetical protein
MAKKISIIIACYNEERFVRENLSNLARLQESFPERFEVVVKDQNSTDSTVSIIQSEYPWVKLICGENDGLSKGYNIAYRSTESDYLLFLGMDAFPEENTLPVLLDYLEKNPDVGAATCKLVTADGSLDMDAHRAFPTPWNSFTKIFGLNRIFPHSTLFNGYFLPDANMEKPHEIDMCISHFFFVRRSVLDEINGFDEDFFLYGEDVDVCYRIKQAGWKILYLPQCSARHLKGGSVGVRKTTRRIVKKSLAHRLKMQKLSAKAMETFLKKHYLKKYPKILVYSMIISTRILGKVRVFLESFR